MHEDKYAYIYMHARVIHMHIHFCLFSISPKMIFKILVKLVTSEEKYGCMWTKDGRSIFLTINFLCFALVPCLIANSKISHKNK